MTIVRLLVCCCLLCVVYTAPGMAATFGISTPASWVVPALVDTAAVPPASASRGGVYYLLVDGQVHMASHHYFQHFTKMILSDAGVQNESGISITFAPAYQRLTFHYIRIIRNGVVINALRRNAIQLLQREERLEGHIYDGTVTAYTALENVRVGDIIDYAYSLQGDNPILRGKFFSSFYTQLSQPVHYLRQRILQPRQRQLYLKSHGTTLAPGIRATATGEEEYVWEARETAPLLVDDDLPVWYDPYPWIQTSEFGSWSEVARWAEGLYVFPERLSPDLQAVVDDIRSRHSGIDAQMSAALRLVQDEIRYYGIETGINSHRPSPPDQVYRRRFGDCKDKSVLLCVLLRGLGVQAYPALVHTDYRHTIADWHPSPAAFNHAIVLVESHGMQFWLDPTISYQRGPIGSIFCPNYGRALVVRPGETELTAIQQRQTAAARTIIHEIFTLDSTGTGARLEVTTQYYGADADRVRAFYAAMSTDEISKNYLNFYATDYKSIRTEAPVHMEDNADDNICTVYEHYYIDHLWQNEGAARQADFYARAIRSDIVQPATSVRSMPIGISHPRTITHTIEIRLPEPWPVEAAATEINDEAFHFASSCTYNEERHIITLTYNYTTATDVVQPERTRDYMQNVELALGELSYTIGNSRTAAGTSTLNWSLLLLSLLFTGVVVAGGIKLYRYEPAAGVLVYEDTGNRYYYGLQGWLRVIGFTLLLRLVVIGSAVYESATFFDMASWVVLTVPGQPSYDPMWAPTLIAELLSDITILGYSVLLLVLFFQKRRSFPRLMALLLVLQFAFAVVLVILVSQFETAESEVQRSVYSNLTSSIVAMALWIPYLFRSRRVAHTFIHHRRSVAAPALPAPISAPPTPPPMPCTMATPDAAGTVQQKQHTVPPSAPADTGYPT